MVQDEILVFRRRHHAFVVLCLDNLLRALLSRQIKELQRHFIDNCYIACYEGENSINAANNQDRSGQYRLRNVRIGYILLDDHTGVSILLLYLLGDGL